MISWINWISCGLSIANMILTIVNLHKTIQNQKMLNAMYLENEAKNGTKNKH